MYKQNVCTISFRYSKILGKYNNIIIIIIVCLFPESLQTYEPDLADDQSTEGNYNILMHLYALNKALLQPGMDRQ